MRISPRPRRASSLAALVQRQMAAASELAPTMCTCFRRPDTPLLAKSEIRGRCGRQIPVRKGHGNDFLPAVMPVLAQRGDQDARPATFLGREGIDQCLQVPDARALCIDGIPVETGNGAVSAVCRPRPASAWLIFPNRGPGPCGIHGTRRRLPSPLAATPVSASRARCVAARHAQPAGAGLTRPDPRAERGVVSCTRPLLMVS